jgi:Methyltransferase domain
MDSLKAFIRRGIRFAAKEFASEVVATLERSQGTAAAPGRARVDIDDLMRQMNSREVKGQLNEFFAWNHRWIALLSERNRRTAASTYDFIESEMADALFVLDQFKVLRSRKYEIVELDGQILDLGVYKGGSTRALAAMFPDRTIHGFDSFEGLPEDWSHALRGDFGEIAGVAPTFPSNVELHKGWFDETLPGWYETHRDEPISLLRVDCDIYSSTKTIFDTLAPLIGPGTWILFDELIGYRGWRDHEYRAFSEFIEMTGLECTYVAYGLTYTLARIR